jgi:hypothetical protein
VAIALLAIAVALIMAPAAYHRQRGPQEVTSTFIHLATRLLLWSMVPLALSICIEFYLVGRVIEDGAIVPLVRHSCSLSLSAYGSCCRTYGARSGPVPSANEQADDQQ